MRPPVRRRWRTATGRRTAGGAGRYCVRGPGYPRSRAGRAEFTGARPAPQHWVRRLRAGSHGDRRRLGPTSSRRLSRAARTWSPAVPPPSAVGVDRRGPARPPRAGRGPGRPRWGPPTAPGRESRPAECTVAIRHRSPPGRPPTTRNRSPSANSTVTAADIPCRSCCRTARAQASPDGQPDLVQQVLADAAAPRHRRGDQPRGPDVRRVGGSRRVTVASVSAGDPDHRVSPPSCWRAPRPPWSAR